MPILSVSWPGIKSRFDGSTKVVALTNRQISMLLTVAEQLTWEKTFRTPDYDWADKDTLDAEVHDLIRWLSMPVDVGDITGYIDEVETLLTEIRDLTQANQPCCGDTTPLPNPYESPNADNYPDTPPATWGESEPIADSDDWQELVCGAAHKYVDILKDTTTELDGLVKTGALIVGGVAGLLALATSAGILSAVAYTAAASATAALIGITVETLLGDAADDLEDARADIVCAIVHQGHQELAAAVEAAVDPEAWLVWYKWIDYETAWNVLLDGGRDGTYLDPTRSTACDCPAPPLPQGASTYPLEVVGLTHTPNDATWSTTVNSWGPDGSFNLTVTHNSTSGHYYYVYLDVAASPYWGIGNHQGILYEGVRMTYTQALIHTPCTGVLHDQCGATCGNGNTDGYWLVCSSPYAGYDTDIATYHGITLNGSIGTKGLTASPDQTRQLAIRFWFKDINQGYTSTIRSDGLFWAINNP